MRTPNQRPSWCKVRRSDRPASPARSPSASTDTRPQRNHALTAPAPSRRTVAASDGVPGGPTSATTWPRVASSSPQRRRSTTGEAPMPMLPSSSSTVRPRAARRVEVEDRAERRDTALAGQAHGLRARVDAERRLARLGQRRQQPARPAADVEHRRRRAAHDELVALAHLAQPALQRDGQAAAAGQAHARTRVMALGREREHTAVQLHRRLHATYSRETRCSDRPAGEIRSCTRRSLSTTAGAKTNGYLRARWRTRTPRRAGTRGSAASRR